MTHTSWSGNAPCPISTTLFVHSHFHCAAPQFHAAFSCRLYTVLSTLGPSKTVFSASVAGIWQQLLPCTFSGLYRGCWIFEGTCGTSSDIWKECTASIFRVTVTSSVGEEVFGKQIKWRLYGTVGVNLITYISGRVRSIIGSVLNQQTAF